MTDHSEGEYTVPNPYTGHDEYHCFGCDPHSPVGLRLSFTVAGDVIRSRWSPRPELEGYPGVIHGGIQATLADEIGGWFLHAIRGTAGMTRELSIRYERPADTTDAPFLLEAREIDGDAKRSLIEVELRGASGTLFSTTRVEYAVFSEQVAVKRLHFPGKEAFRP
ncbi:MAG: PaaI family thioesterase [Alkalispirochaeta sp.]